MTNDATDNLSESWLRRLKNRPAIAVIVVLGAVVTGIASFTDSVGKIAGLFQSDARNEAEEGSFRAAETAYRLRRSELISLLYDRQPGCRVEEKRCPPPTSACEATRRVCPRRSSDRAAVEALKELIVIDREHYVRIESRMNRLARAGRCKIPNDEGCSIPANRNSDLRGVDLEGASLADLDLRQVTLTDSNLRRVSFRLSRLDDSSLAGCDLSGADFYRAILRSVSLAYSNAKGADFTEANLQDVYWTGATCPDGRVMRSQGSCF